MILKDIDTEDRDTGLKSIIKEYYPITVKTSKGVLKDFDKLRRLYIIINYLIENTSFIKVPIS